MYVGKLLFCDVVHAIRRMSHGPLGREGVLNRKKLKPYHKWIGEWTGRGETLKGVPVLTRVQIRPRLADLALEFCVESMHEDSHELVHGVVAQLGVDPDGELRMTVYSTLHGSIIMPVTPEDPGALAIGGTSIAGNRVVVSLIEENDGLMLTSYWKPELPADAEPVGYTNVKLERVIHAD